MAAKQAAGMLRGQVGMADGGIARVRASRISVVLALAAAISALYIDAAADSLDRQHFAHLFSVALAHTRT
jgi:hypothetical protein